MKKTKGWSRQRELDKSEKSRTEGGLHTRQGKEAPRERVRVGATGPAGQAGARRAFGILVRGSLREAGEH